MTKMTLITTRRSGDSYLNRVELQNGCLCRGHSNTFIPSTLHGSPYSENGEFDTKIHEKNMSAALDQYISRVDGTPCMKTVIHLPIATIANLGRAFANYLLPGGSIFPLLFDPHSRAFALFKPKKSNARSWSREGDGYSWN